MKTGSSRKNFTDAAGNFDRKKFLLYKKYNALLTSLCRDGYGVEIVGDVFRIMKLHRCPDTLRFSQIIGKFRLTDKFEKMPTQRQKERILKTLKNDKNDN